MTLLADVCDKAALLLVNFACHGLQDRRPDWSRAMRAEFDEIPCCSERLRWAMGCAATLATDLIGEITMTYIATLLLALTLVANFEWRADEDMVTMIVLLIASISLGWLRPRFFLLSGVLIGLVVPLLNLLTLTTGVRPAYETAAQAQSHGANYVLSLLILIFPAIFGSFVGRFVRIRTSAPTNSGT